MDKLYYAKPEDMDMSFGRRKPEQSRLREIADMVRFGTGNHSVSIGTTKHGLSTPVAVNQTCPFSHEDLPNVSPGHETQFCKKHVSSDQ